jgi:diguanylate cyclase (GGDEF)-like protein
VAFDTIKRLIDSDQARLQRNRYFVDGKGNIVLAAATAKRLNILKSPGISAIAPHILSNKKSEAQALEYKTETGSMLLNARFIPELGWYLLVEQDLGSAVKPLQDMLMLNAAIGGFITLIILIMLTLVVRRYQSRLEKSAATDQLTTLMNRQAFDFVFANALLDSERSRQPMCVALIDIDFFKKMNDKHGHLVGDHVLREIAMISKRSLRESDVICRWGGEEFLILLKNCTLEKATSIAENLRATIAANDFSRTTDLARKRLSVTVSMGVAECKDKETEDSVFERADVALSQAKESGRNSVYFAE